MRRYPSQRGFSLVELAIVMAVIALIIAGIWYAAASATRSNKEARGEEFLDTIVDNVRTYYSAQLTIPTTIDQNTLTTNLDQVGVFPSPTRNNPNSTTFGNIINPWGGDIRVNAQNLPANSGHAFQVIYWNVPKNSCINLVTKTSVDWVETGLQNLNGQTTFPVPTPTASAVCGGTTNTITWTYSLRR